jgi:lysophospholipase L1-like esterase
MKIGIPFFLGILAALSAAPAQAQTNDKAQANSYDDAWKTAWVTHCRTMFSSAAGKTPGFVLEIGDSITYANPYSQWPRQATSSAAGDSPSDSDIFTWCHSTAWDTGSSTDTGVTNGWYLAATDVNPGARGMTASSGEEAVEYVSGAGNGSGGTMPTATGSTSQATARGWLIDAVDYPNNLQINTVAVAFSNAQVAVVMLGTNDARNAIDLTSYGNALTTIVNVLEGQNIVVVLSTVPPSKLFDVTPYNTQIRSLAQTRGLPLIDFYAEILSRQPVNWDPALINNVDNIHPTASGTGPSGTAYTSSSDPYAGGGNPATNATGEACTVVGYLLRSWLTIQKLKEVKSYVVDGANPPAPPSGASTGSGGGGGGGGCGLTGLEAALLLGVLRGALRLRPRRTR